MEPDKSDPTAIKLTYLTGIPKQPQETQTIYAESKEVCITFQSQYASPLSIVVSNSIFLATSCSPP